MNIKPAIYEKLTAQERVIASLEALARDDEKERVRLVKTCPKKNYNMSDHAYSSKMEAFLDIALVIEADMRGCVLNFFIQLFLEDNLDRDKCHTMHELMETSPCQIQKMISIKQAWHEFLEDEGIDVELAEKAYKDLHHTSIKWMTTIANNMDLEPDAQVFTEYKDLLKEYMSQALA